MWLFKMLEHSRGTVALFRSVAKIEIKHDVVRSPSPPLVRFGIEDLGGEENLTLDHDKAAGGMGMSLATSHPIHHTQLLTVPLKEKTDPHQTVIDKRDPQANLTI